MKMNKGALIVALLVNLTSARGRYNKMTFAVPHHQLSNSQPQNDAKQWLFLPTMM
ncbi:hypothetical protein DJICPGNB_27170 [Escherichia coli]|nr:hypothetical protein DJICPGNB_27170 [Escherichia coli]